MVRDRVVQASAKLVLEPIFEAGFGENSYGFRPRRSAQQAVERIRRDVNFGRYFIVDVDIADFFNSLDHTLLLRLVARRISDRRVLRLVRLWLKAGVMKDGVAISTLAGVPQGGVISPLLANIYGHVLDALWEKEAAHLGTMIRYADDMVVLCHNEQSATLALEWLRNKTHALHLTLHPEKTRVVSLVKGRDGFDFLGFHFRLEKSRKQGKWYCYRWPSRRTMAAVRQKIRAITAPRYKLTWPIQDVVAELNPVLRGWGNYYRTGNSSRKFVQIDSYVRLRLGLFDMHKRRRRGWWRLRHYHRRWCRELGTYLLTGTVLYAHPPTVAT